MPEPPVIFVNYRRQNSAPWATAIRMALEKHFGSTTIFQDVDRIDPGDDWAEKIERNLERSVALIVVIAEGWHAVQREGIGTRRIDDLNDWVRHEIRTALTRAPPIPIFTVLLDEAQLPKAEWLPEDIRGLIRGQSHTVRTDKLERDLQELSEVISRKTKGELPELGPQAAHAEQAPSILRKSEFWGSRENSGSIFEDLESGSRQRFGSHDTKHNDTLWIGRRSDRAVTTAFLEVHLTLPGVPLDRVEVKAATFLVEEFAAVEDHELTRWMGPLMVLAVDYGELDVSDLDGLLDRGELIRSYENIYDLYKPTTITQAVRGLFARREERLRMAFTFPGHGRGDAGMIKIEPSAVKVSLEYVYP